MRIEPWLPVGALLLVLAAAAPGSLQAQVSCSALGPLNVGPTVIRDDGGSHAMGLRARGELCRAGIDFRPEFPRSWQAGFKVDASVPTRDLRMPQNVEIGAHAGGYLSLFRLTDDGEDDWGILGAAARLRYEADSGFDEQSLTGGGEIRWVDVTRSYLPSVVFTAEFVTPTSSQLRDALALDRDAYRRLEARAYWYHAFEQKVFVELDAGWFQASGLDAALEAAGLDGGSYVAPGAGLLLDTPLPGGLALRSIFVEYAHGQRPTGTRSEKAVSVGVEVGSQE